MVSNFRMSFCCFPKSSGVNTWRDQLKPTQLLQNVARFKGYAPPILSENGRKINYGGRDYTLEEAGELAHFFNVESSFLLSFRYLVLKCF